MEKPPKRRRLSSGSQTSKEKTKDEGSDEEKESSPPRCPICLEPPENAAKSDSCSHYFCFSCLKEWSKVKAECPLCKMTIRSIFYDIRSDSQYGEYKVKDPRPRDSGDDDALGLSGIQSEPTVTRRTTSVTSSSGGSSGDDGMSRSSDESAATMTRRSTSVTSSPNDSSDDDGRSRSSRHESAVTMTRRKPSATSSPSDPPATPPLSLSPHLSLSLSDSSDDDGRSRSSHGSASSSHHDALHRTKKFLERARRDARRRESSNEEEVNVVIEPEVTSSNNDVISAAVLMDNRTLPSVTVMSRNDAVMSQSEPVTAHASFCTVTSQSDSQSKSSPKKIFEKGKVSVNFPRSKKFYDSDSDSEIDVEEISSSYDQTFSDRATDRLPSFDDQNHPDIVASTESIATWHGDRRSPVTYHYWERDSDSEIDVEEIPGSYRRIFVDRSAAFGTVTIVLECLTMSWSPPSLG